MGLATNRLAECRVKGLRASREGILEKQATDCGIPSSMAGVTCSYVVGAFHCANLPLVPSIISMYARRISSPKQV